MINCKEVVDNNNWKLIPTTTGVYTIHNKITDTIYIGSAGSKRGFRARLNQHINGLIKDKHNNKYMQASFNKYGIKAFSFNIVELCEPSKCVELEQVWIDFKFGNNCFNLNPVATTSLGSKLNNSKPSNREYTSFYVITPNKDVVEVHNLKQYAKDNNLNDSDCYRVAQYKKAQVQGYVFKYLDEKLDAKYKSTNVTPVGKFPKLAKILCPDGTEVILQNRELEKFEREVIGKSSGILAGICSGKSKAKSYYGYKGYYCNNDGIILPEVLANIIKREEEVYKNNCNRQLNKPIIKFENINTKEIIYTKDRTSVCKTLNLKSNNVSDCIAGRISNTKGWKITRIYE